MVLDEAGKPSIGPISLGTRDSFRDKSVTQAVLEISKEACTWHTLSRRIASVQDQSKGSDESKHAVLELKVYLQEILLPQPLHLLRSRFSNLPAAKAYVFRKTKRRAGKFDHRILFINGCLSPLPVLIMGFISRRQNTPSYSRVSHFG